MIEVNKVVAAHMPKKSPAILGTFEGECADANITNKNGMDITRPVWENVFASDDYNQAIELGWYIGFLGHPEDPNCMDFEHACIVMVSGHIDENGKVYGKFNLIDTPVGRIVKAFIDAGVVFGISVRGAGDIIDSSVDPETFIFRGFDLVTFPAFPESIPTFSEVAASTDLVKRARYKSVCSAVKANLDRINSCESLDIIQSQFAKQSDEYKAIESRKTELSEEYEDMSETKLQSMTNLYLDELNKNSQLIIQNEKLKRELATVKVQCSRKVRSIQRITSAQFKDVDKDRAIISSELDKVSAERDSYISANKRLNLQLNRIKNSNLKYKQKIESNTQLIDDQKSTISQLRTDLTETVNAASTDAKRTSNLGAKVTSLESKLAAAEALVSEYQDAYATLYANALGARLDNVVVTATTTVSQLQSLISGTNPANMSSVFVEPLPIALSDDLLEDELITM